MNLSTSSQEERSKAIEEMKLMMLKQQKTRLREELRMASQIIINALNIMTIEQKRTWGVKNAMDGVDGTIGGITRYHERNDLLAATEL